MQHTSGLPEPAGEGVKDDEIGSFYLTKNTKYADPKFVIRERMKGALLFTPGSKFKYNNGDYLVVQRVLEKAYKEPFAEILALKIANPLGLKNTGMLSNDNRQLKVSKLPRAMLKGYELAEEKIVPEPNIAIENFGAAGAMYSNASDLAKFGLALSSGKLLSAESTQIMLTGDSKLGYLALGAWVFPLQLDNAKAASNLSSPARAQNALARRRNRHLQIITDGRYRTAPCHPANDKSIAQSDWRGVDESRPDV